MKKLIGCEVVMTAWIIAAVIAGNLFELPIIVTIGIIATVTVLIAFIVAFATPVTTNIFITTFPVATTAFTSIVITTAVFFVSPATTVLSALSATFRVIITAIALTVSVLSAFAAANELELKCYWVFSTLLAEGAAVWVILFYGLKI